ncbi:MAG: SAM-dependent methyltransferase [Clostridia bacterium]|nr:SAM-dependent methyltransferase [Clostridia bacterium]
MRIESVMTPRLFAIAECVPQGAKLCDVGTDHGYIPIYLCQKKRITKALAMDLRPGPLSRADENIARYGLSDCIGTRLSDGLLKLNGGEADTAVIAGMGGLLIAEILKAQPYMLDCYILQPMTAVAELRQFLVENGYRICDEHLAREEEKIYTVLVVRPGGKEPYSQAEYLVGKRLMGNRDPLTPALITNLLTKYREARSGLQLSDKESAKEKAEQFSRIISDLEKMEQEAALW